MNFLEKLILALDFASAQEALLWVDRFLPYVKTFKVGKQLFTKEGPSVIRDIQKKGGRVFLDLKFHDIPNTVFEASRSAADLGVFMFNVHATGGLEMMRGARLAIDRWSIEGKPHHQKPLIIAVTLLTSLSQEDFEDLSLQGDPQTLILKYATLAKQAGLDGVVCSVHEVSKIKQALGNNFLTITPGIRFEGAGGDDQKRAAHLEQALKEGADYLVVGRTLFKSSDPVGLLKLIIEKFSDA